MGAVRRRARYVAIATTLLAAGLVWLLSRSPGDGPSPAPDAPSAPREAAGEAALAVAPGEARVARPTATVGAATAGDASRPPSSFRLRVHVVTGTLPPSAGALVTVSGRVGSKDVYLARAALDPEARATLDVPALQSEPPWLVTVRSEVPGLGRGSANVSARAGDVQDVEIRPEYDQRLLARVVDAEGHPVAHLRLVVLNGGANLLAVQALPDPGRDEAVASWDSSILGTAVSGEDGRFDLDGVVDGALSFASLDERWWLEAADGSSYVVPGEGEVEIRARPAFRLEVDVAPADPHDDPATWSGVEFGFEMAPPAAGNSWGLGSFDRRAFFRGPVPDARGFAIRLYVDTFEHHPDVRTVPFAPGAWSQKVDASLVRFSSNERGTLVVAPTLLDAAGKAASLALTCYRRVGEHTTAGASVKVARRADGAMTAVLPAGRQEIEIQPDFTTRDLFTWRGTVDVEAATETEFRVPWPPTGALEVEVPAEWVGREILVGVQRTGDRRGGLSSVTPKEPTVRFAPVPAGALTVTVQCGATIRTIEATVKAGDETVVDASR